VKSAYKILVGKSEWKKLIEIPRPRGKDDVKMNLKKMGFGAVETFVKMNAMLLFL
jgi:hypothetical protein